jgi:hypothetical protein
MPTFAQRVGDCSREHQERSGTEHRQKLLLTNRVAERSRDTLNMSNADTIANRFPGEDHHPAARRDPEWS